MSAELPWRRPAVAETLAGPAGTLHVRAGFDPRDGRLVEIFVRAKTPAGSERDAMLDDAAILASKAIQAGADAGELARAMTPGGDMQRALHWAVQVQAA